MNGTHKLKVFAIRSSQISTGILKREFIYTEYKIGLYFLFLRNNIIRVYDDNFEKGVNLKFT